MKGGKRAGAGRPRRTIEVLDARLTVRVAATEAAALVARAERLGVSVSELGRTALLAELARCDRWLPPETAE